MKKVTSMAVLSLILGAVAMLEGVGVVGVLSKHCHHQG